jgi:peptidyl-prolyl cis-trans isomerase SurA
LLNAIFVPLFIAFFFMRFSFPARACTFIAVYVLSIFAPQYAAAQEDPTGVTDKVIAVIGRNKIILQSELEAQFSVFRQQDPNISDTAKGDLLQQMVVQKLLVEQAEHDSLLISDEEVESNLENKLRYFIRQYGTKERMEEIAGKTVYQIKEDNREVIKEQMLAERMKSKVLENVKITPSEIRVFFEKIPLDSLPFFPATIEVGQIVIDPPVSPEIDTLTRQKLLDIRNQIVNDGKSFETMAGLYSEDPGSRDEGGMMRDIARTALVPEFATAAFKLQNGEISGIVKTVFGYHIIQMVQRKGEQADIRHILIRPPRTTADFKVAFNKLDSVRALLIAGVIGFPEAVGKFSTDDAAKQTGGMITDPQTGSAQLEIDKLDPAMVTMLDTLKPGTYSQPQMFQTERGEQSARIVYVKTRTEPHKANMKDDYSKIQEVALQQKQGKVLQEWLVAHIPTYYMKLAPEYRNYAVFKDWKLATD